MAEHADGSIIVDTEIDTQGFKAGSSELQRAIKSLNTKMEALGPTFQKALSGNANALATFDAKASALENIISDLETKLESLGNTRLPTEEYQWLTTEIEKAEKELSRLEEKQLKMEDMGVKRSSQAWKSLQYDIAEAMARVKDYKDEQIQMQTSGTAFQMGTDTAEYAQLEATLSSARDGLVEMREQADNAGQSTSKLGAIANACKSGLSAIGKVGAKGFSLLARGIKSNISYLKNFKKSSGAAGGAIGILTKKLTGMCGMLKRMAMRKLMAAILSGVKEGVNNLAQYSNQTNASLSTLKSGLTRLKNSLATAFAPILTVVTPALSKLINYLSEAITYVGKLFAALTGTKTFTKATQVQEDYAASLKSTEKAAKKAGRQLAGFDELNVLGDNSSDGDAESGVSPSEMFEEVPIESSITDFVGRIKDAYKNGNFAEIGEIIGNGINTALQRANDFIKWENIGGTITKIVTGFAEGFNSLIHTENWELLGDTIAQGLNSALNTIYLIITEFDWPAVAASLSRSLNGLVSGFDWGKLGTTLSTGFITALKVIRSAITTFNWADLGKGVADGINQIDWVGAFSQAAGALSDAVKGLLDLCIGFAENLNWGKLGSDLWNSLVGIITNIDWGGIITKAFELLGMAVAGAAKLIIGFARSLWESLKSAFESTKNYFSKYIDEAGGNVILGLLNGIWNGIKNIGVWIKEHIFDPFINGFKKVFGIHSPSTVMTEMGGFLIEGLLNGIKNLWNGITSFFSNALSSLSSLISNAWSGIKSVASSAWNGIKNTISSAWSGIKSGVSNACSAVGSAVSSAWSNVKNHISTNLNNAKTAASNAWNSIKATASTINNNIKSTVSSAWDGLKSTMSSKLSSIKDSVSSTFSTLKNSASTWGKDVCSNMANGIKNAAGKVKDAVSGVANKIKSFLGFSEPEDGPLSNFHTYMPDMIDLMTKGIKQNQGTAINAVSDMAAAISNEIQNGDYAMGGIGIDRGVDATLASFSNSITDGFINLLDRLQAIASGVHFAVPIAASGTLIPHGSKSGFNETGRAPGNSDEIRELVVGLLDDQASVMLAGFEAVVNAINQKENCVVVGDDMIGKAAERYNRRMSIVRGGTY